MIALNKPITLIGLSGSGKSTIGKMFAEKFGVQFADTDAAIEQQTGQSIRSYFSQYGEPAFREIEKQALRDLINHGIYDVIATGGGCILSEQNRLLLKEKTFVVYLECSIEQLSLRLQNDIQRPLLNGDLTKKLSELLLQRENLYRETAHFTVNSHMRDAEQTVQLIFDQISLNCKI